MRSLPIIASALIVTAVSTSSAANELMLEPEAIRNLGIEFAAPRTEDAVAAVTARAHVIIPPASEYVISSTLPGLVARVHASVGERVEAGQILVDVRSPAFLTLQQEYLEALHFGALADAQLGRDEQLAEEGIIAERRLQETRASTRAAVSRLAEHRQLLRIAGMRDSDIRDLEKRQALKDTFGVRAPVDGVILELMAKAGESVDSVAALYRMADLSVLWLDIHVPQEAVGHIEPGMLVDVGESVVDRPASVIAIGQAVDPRTQVVSVRAELTAAGHGLKPGQLVSASVVAADSSNGFTAVHAIPTRALMRSGDGAYVFLRSANGVAVQAVNVVGATAGEVLVRNLAADAEVAVSGVSALKALWLESAD